MDIRSQHSTSALDLAVSTLAAASAAFVLFAMPADLFAGIVTATRLPDILAAARPPLGDTARAVACAGAFVFVFAFVFTLMRALDGLSEPAPVAEAEEDELQLRPGDIHPDAPPRRPLFALDEIGEPAPPRSRPPAKAPQAAAERPVEAARPKPAPAQAKAQKPVPAEAAKAPEPAPAAVRQTHRLPSFLSPEQPAEPAEAAKPAPRPAKKPQAPPQRAPQPQPQRATAEKSESVSQLMQRLERGLGRRQKQHAIAPARASAEMPPQPEGEDRVGHRLRSAISELQKIAARGG